MPSESVELAMLRVVAWYDPIDSHRLKRLVRERVGGGYDSDRHREALSNLKELNMVDRGGLGHEYVHITNFGWQHLGGETSRHDEEIESVDAPVCDVCAEDELVENAW
ncbi:hypothetical protein [Haloarchaeobius litoreus]|uniref:Uncharacterized protein n=1 Tax=Haloarchaeobius litoreus TaxID=755306 RepID=A0ABD6DK39_9EURY|nr:hypothetical protein [Haloarchaeobius litoreus]